MTAGAGPDAAGTAPAPATERLRVLLVTGLSGAGRTTALKLLEDMGYEAVDNVPLALVDGLAFGSGPRQPLAIGFDTRSRDFAEGAVLERIEPLMHHPELEVRLIFLTCSDEVLRRRFTETRRRHPLALDRPVTDGISAELRLLEPLRARADLVIDTSGLAIADLRQLLRGHFGLASHPAMAIGVVSFSYRYGLPREADLVFDVRFLRNPHYQPGLRDLTGVDPEVAAFIEADPAFAPFYEALTGLLEPLLGHYEREGKSYLTIAVGCTGGRHRSVGVAERLAAWLRGQGRAVSVRHR
ncbi:MAG: RNase adapter RapZ, partial [Rhodospirillaceae bacterium]|nr:RNase adapter RapZ [Rhodospirillaceae bacterium]